jgi:hypothetical protein
MSAFYRDAIDRLTALLSRNSGALVCHESSMIQRHFAGFSTPDLRAICERGIADGLVGGYGHRRSGNNRILGITSFNGPALSGFRAGFNTKPDNATCYVVLHPDRKGRATVAKFGRTGNLKQRLRTLFPDAQRRLTREDVFSLDSANATQVEQVLRLAFSALTVGGNNRKTREYLRAPHFEGDVTRNIGQNARTETFALMVAAIQTAVSEIAALDTIDRHDPAQRVKIANRLVRRLSLQFNVRTVKTEAGHFSFAR